jgi:hypothetical protein
MAANDLFWTPDPNQPQVLGTNTSWFGEQKGAGTDPNDAGGFAYGGRSTDNPENYAALDPMFAQKGVIQPGQWFPVWSPKDPENKVWVHYKDAGPSRTVESTRGVGADLAPSVFEQLGIKPGDPIHFDLLQATDTNPESSNDYPSVSPDTSKLMAQSGNMSGTMSTDTMESPTVNQYPDGSYDLGDGYRGFPNGVIQARSGNSVQEYIPDANSKSGYKLRSYNVKNAPEPPPPIPQGATAEEALKLLPETDRIQAQMYASHQLPAFGPRGGKINPDFLRLLPYIQKINPNVSPKTYYNQFKTQQEFASNTQTSPGGSLNSIWTAIHHLQQLYEISKRLPASNIPIGQKLENIMNSQLGGTEVTDYRTMKQILATEITRALTGGVPALSEIEKLEKTIDESLSSPQRTSQLLKVIPTMLSARLVSLNSGWRRSMNDDMPLDKLIDKPSQEALLSMGITKFGGRDLAQKNKSNVVYPKPSDRAKTYLLQHPELKDTFNERYGAGAAEAILGQ